MALCGKGCTLREEKRAPSEDEIYDGGEELFEGGMEEEVKG